MKKQLLLVTCLFLFGNAWTQDGQVPDIKKKIDGFLKDRSKKAVVNPFATRRAFTQEQLKARLQTIVKNNSVALSEDRTVVVLPGDNMACVVPSMKEYNMPNAWNGELKKSGAGVMPNPGEPMVVIPPPEKKMKFPDVKIRVSPYNTLPFPQGKKFR